jgi:hypothetical protein
MGDEAPAPQRTAFKQIDEVLRLLERARERASTGAAEDARAAAALLDRAQHFLGMAAKNIRRHAIPRKRSARLGLRPRCAPDRREGVTLGHRAWKNRSRVRQNRTRVRQGRLLLLRLGRQRWKRHGESSRGATPARHNQSVRRAAGFARPSRTCGRGALCVRRASEVPHRRVRPDVSGQPCGTCCSSARSARTDLRGQRGRPAGRRAESRNTSVDAQAVVDHQRLAGGVDAAGRADRADDPHDRTSDPDDRAGSGDLVLVAEAAAGQLTTAGKPDFERPTPERE